MNTHASPISVTLIPETAYAPATGGMCQLLVELEGRAPAVVAPRRPLNLAIVLDRSGSMAGRKLDLARNAALHLIHQLDARDRIAIAVYDDDVHLLVSGAPVTPERLPVLSMVLASVRPGSSTNLEGGWHAGVQAVAQEMEQAPGALPRVLLVTDGLANIGIIDPAALSSLAMGVAAHGIVTSTFGVGEDYDEQLLTAMAEAGGGNAYHIASAADIHGRFQQELSDLFGVIAEDVSVRIRLPSEMRATLLNPAVAATYTPAHITVPVGFVGAGDTPQFVLQLTVPSGSEGKRHDIQVSVRWKEGNGHAHIKESLRWPVAGVVGDPDPRVLAAVARQKAARARHDASVRERNGDFQGAAIVLRETSATIAAMPLASIPTEAVTLDGEADEMEQGSSMAQRKRMHYEVHRIKRSKRIDPDRS